MGVIYIGDRATGKTSLAIELANPRGEYVKVTSSPYQNLKDLLHQNSIGQREKTSANKAIYSKSLTIEVRLPARTKQVTINSIDTPGEIWRKKWQEDNPDMWEDFLNTARQSDGILLILSPYREILNLNVIQKAGMEADDFLTQQQWCNRFNRWVDFFRYECPKAQHILICLNKADLFCNLREEASTLAYNPDSLQNNWFKRHHHVINSPYFKPIQPQIAAINQSISGLSVVCFLTSIYNRQLLELPWIYLGAYLGR